MNKLPEFPQAESLTENLGMEYKKFLKTIAVCLGFAWILFLIPIAWFGLVGWGLVFAALIASLLCIAKGGLRIGIFGLIVVIVGSPAIYAIGLCLHTIFLMNIAS